LIGDRTPDASAARPGAVVTPRKGRHDGGARFPTRCDRSGRRTKKPRRPGCAQGMNRPRPQAGRPASLRTC